MRRLKYLLAGVVFALFLLPVVVPTLAATNGTLVQVEPTTTQVGVGETVLVQVVAYDVTDLMGVSLRLTFDPTLLDVLDMDPVLEGVQVGVGGLLGEVVVLSNTVDMEGGHISLQYFRSETFTGVSGSGPIAAITFLGKGPGLSALNLAEISLIDSAGIPLDVTMRGGQITVTGAGLEPSPTGTPLSNTGRDIPHRHPFSNTGRDIPLSSL